MPSLAKSHPIDRLVAVAEEVFSLPRGQLLLHERGAFDYIAHRRQLVYLVAYEAGFSQKTIGDRMDRERTVVRYGVRAATRRVGTDKMWAERKQALLEEWEYADALAA